jgi:hypothetical protein
MTSSSTRKPRAYRLDDPEVAMGSIVIGDRLA